MSSTGRGSGFRECARKARDLIQPVLDTLESQSWSGNAGQDQELLASANDTLVNAFGRLLSVDKSIELDDSAMRQELTRAYDAMEMASAALGSAQSSDAELDECRHRLAQALALVFASGGAKKVMPPLKRSSTSLRAVRASSMPPAPSESTGPTSSTYPAIEVGEVGLEAIAEFAPEVAAWLMNPTAELGQQDVSVEQTLRARGSPPKEHRSQWSILEVEVGFVGEHNFFAGLTMDVCEGGLFVATYQSRPVGTKLMLSFVLPDGHAITAPGIVKFVIEARGDVPPGMGVAFLELSPADVAAIRSFCKKREPIYYDT